MENYSELAFNLVNNILRLKKNNVISISGELYNDKKSISAPLQEIPLIEELAVAIRKKFAFPILELSTTNLQKRFFSEMPESIYSLSPDYYKNWIAMIDSFIEIGWQKYFSEFESKTNAAEMNDTSQNILEQIFENNKKMVFLNYPNQDLAEILNLNYRKLLSAYHDSVNCDYRALYKQGLKLKERYFSSANYFIEDMENLLELKIIKDEANLNCANATENPLIVLPAGFIDFPLLRPSLNGIFRAERVYWQKFVFADVKIMFNHGNIRYVNFKDERKENFLLQNALMQTAAECQLTIGFNPQIYSYTNYSQYDRCLNENITITFSGPAAPSIFCSTLTGKIIKQSKKK
jgi:hypothetical protein